MKLHAWAATAALLMMSPLCALAQAVPPAVQHALDDSARADQKADDAERKAADVIAFSGVKAGDTVVDFLPGKGYWTRIFTDIVGPKGHVYAVWPHAGAKYATETLPALQARHLANVTAEVLPADPAVFPTNVDVFWTVQNYHDVANSGGEAALATLNKAVFTALKPGGTYVIIDHADAVGTGISGTSTKHRIEKAAVIKQVTAAGFVLAGESPVLANPQDTHEAKVFDPSIKGHTDKFVLKFKKPA